MQIRDIDDIGALERLRPQWTALWERTERAGPFQHPDWLLPWWRHLGGGELLAFAVLERDELVGLAPFYIHRDRASGIRQLTLLGNGVSDTCDVLLDPAVPPARRGLLERMAQPRGAWNACDFRDVPCGSALLAPASELGGAVREDSRCVVVELAGWPPGSVAKFLADVDRRRRRAAELAPVAVERVAAAEIAGAIGDLFALHAARWHGEGQPGMLRGAGLAAFHREVAERFDRRGWLRLYRSHFGARLAAANYGFHVRSRAYSYIGGFAPELARFSPGSTVIHRAVCDAAAEGAAEFDFLRGEEPYKFRWGGRSRPQYRFGASLASSERAVAHAP